MTDTVTKEPLNRKQVNSLKHTFNFAEGFFTVNWKHIDLKAGKEIVDDKTIRVWTKDEQVVELYVDGIVCRITYAGAVLTNV